MGCDIHLYVEQKTKSGKWIRISDKRGPKHPYYDESATESHKAFFDSNAWTTGRNYAVFGRLAGVRAGHIVPIAEPKGIPKDMAAGTAKEWKQWGMDAHTPSWLTAKELLKVKDEPLRTRHCLSISEYKKYLESNKTKMPDLEDKWVWGRPKKVPHLISNEEMEKIISLMAFWDGIEYLTDVIVEDEALNDHFDDSIFTSILPRMLEIEPDPKKIRIVFWFDN